MKVLSMPRLVMLVIFGLLSVGGSLTAQESGSAQHSYDQKIRETFDFAFGAGNISLPGNAATEGNAFIPPTAFPTAEYCSHCHTESYHQWRQSLHSNSFREPFYRTSVNILRDTKGIEFTRHCDSCHNPIGVVSGALTKDAQVDRSFDRDGVTCMTCHSIQRVQPTVGNGSYLMGLPAVMVDEKGNRVPGLVPDAEILAHPERHSKAVMQDFYRTSEFCSACHKANLPSQLNDYKWIRAFTAYDEWQNSKFSKRNPLTFYSADLRVCQNCHMMRVVPTEREDGAKRGTFVSHRWLAGNTAVPFYYGFDQQLEKTKEFLKSGMYMNVDFFGIRKPKEDEVFAPLGSTPFTLAAGETIETMVVIQNKNIGHSLIPEVRDLYEAWVEFEVKDSSGKEIYHSGFLNPNGSIDERAHSFTNRPVDAAGEFTDNHKVWQIHSVAYDNTIQSGRSSLVRYQFRIPPDAKGPLTFSARVNYRHFRQSYLNNVLGPDHPAYPVVELGERTRMFYLGTNLPGVQDARDNPDWMRWNNLGISYLDQLQYSQALAAFNHVVSLRPDYADGYINVALTQLQWEKYTEARPYLEKALALSPNNARALYYLGLVERRSGNPQEEIADLKKVVELYPMSIDARRELGISYYQGHQYEEARAQFEALQGIDPDDLAAHYNLAVLYRRMGMKQKAAEQAAMFATKQVDPSSPTYSLDFLRKHPEISIESSPWHVHQQLPPSPAGAIAQVH
jgi:tetratricopeptide (TPR) repeat protein